MVLALVACTLSIANLQAGSDSGFEEYPVRSPQDSTRPTPDGAITVYAAASLTDAFMEIGEAFSATHPGAKVNFSFAGSQVLRTQLEQGAIADVFASADQRNMDNLIAEKLVAPDGVQDFALNELVVVLPPDNPARLQSLSDLARPNLKLILADASVPAGGYAREILINLNKDPANGEDYSARVLKNVVSNETDVRQVVTKVGLGEADAGIVYLSDAVASANFPYIEIPDHYNVIVHYPIGLLNHSPNPGLANSFIAYVASREGQAILQKWGFSRVQ